MTAQDSSDKKLNDRANRLYWESDDSVNEIAEQLDLSKSALYQKIEGLDADEPCAQCGGALEYANRTARDKGVVRCPLCGSDAASPKTVKPTRRSTRSVAKVPSRTPDPVADRQALLGAALLGTAALMLLVRWTRN